MAGSNNWIGGTSTDLGATPNWAGGSLPLTSTAASTMGTCTYYPASGACNLGGGLTLTTATNARIDGGCFACPITVNTVAANAGIRGGTFLNTVGGTGNIVGGNFYGAVTVASGGTISGGNFYGTVTVNSGGTISGGTFHGAVTNNGTVSGGLFNIANGALAAGQGVSNATYFCETPAIAQVVTTVTGGQYPTTATSQAAQYTTDAAEVTAKQQYIYPNANLLGKNDGTLRASNIGSLAGTTNLTAAMLSIGVTIDNVVGNSSDTTSDNATVASLARQGAPPGPGLGID